MPLADRNDPYLNYRFRVEITGLIVAGFSEISGLQAETQVEEYRAGGVNDHVYRLAKETRYPNLVLKRGITDSDVLWQWHQDVINGKISRLPVYIMLMDISGQNVIWRRNFFQAYPVKWVGPDLKADGNLVAIETIELAHDGIKKG